MITTDELRSVPLFATLPDEEAATLAARLADVRLREGDWLLHEGEQPSFFMLIEGALEVRKLVHGKDRRLDVYRTGTYFGELPLLLGSPAIASLRALESSRVAQLDQGDFTMLFAECETFASELTRTMTQRFARLRSLAGQAPPATATIVGHRYDIACHHLRDFLARNRVVFRWLDPTRPDLAGDVPPPREGDRYPLVLLPDGERLVTLTLRELAERLGLQTVPRETVYDLAIIGGGPAGLAAAVYGASEGLRTILLERERRAGRPARRRASRITLGSRPACPARSCRRARCSRRSVSGPRCWWRARSKASCPRRRDRTGSSWTAAKAWAHARSSSPPASAGASSMCRGPTGWWAAASTTARRAPRRSTARASMCTWSAAGTPQGRRRCSSPTTHGAYRCWCAALRSPAACRTT